MGFCSRNCSKCNCSGRRAEAAFPLSTAASWESWQSHHHAATVLLRCMGSQWHFWRGLSGSGRSCSSDIFQSIQLFSPSQKFGKPFSAICPAPSLLKATDKNGVSKIALIVRRFEKKKSQLKVKYTDWKAPYFLWTNAFNSGCFHLFHRVKVYLFVVCRLTKIQHLSDNL